MNRITPNLLSDTINLVQLARETALARGNQDQAERLGPVANNLLDLASTARSQPVTANHRAGATSPGGMQTSATANATASATAYATAYATANTSVYAGVMGQSDFQTLLNALQTNRAESIPQAARPEAAAERNQVVTAMASAGMADVEIARFMGVTREEIRLILNVQSKR